LKTGCVSGGVFFPEENKTVVPSEREMVRINPIQDTVIVSRMNTPELVGEVAYIDRDFPNLFLPDRLWLISVKNGVHCKWFNYLMVYSRSVMQEIATGTSGSMKNISQEKLNQMLVPVPSFSEQKMISDAISTFDDVIHENDNHRKRLKVVVLSQDRCHPEWR
jgi:type I restriction enzyme S subunit